MSRESNNAYSILPNGKILNRATNREMWCYYDELKELFEMYKTGKFTLSEMAQWFGMSIFTISTTINKRKELSEVLNRIPRKSKYAWEINPLGYNEI